MVFKKQDMDARKNELPIVDEYADHDYSYKSSHLYHLARAARVGTPMPLWYPISWRFCAPGASNHRAFLAKFRAFPGCRAALARA
jgi:hypothetical protein